MNFPSGLINPDILCGIFLTTAVKVIQLNKSLHPFPSDDYTFLLTAK